MRTPYWCVSWLIPNLGGLEAVISEAEARANELANRMPVVVADVLYVPQAGALDFYGAGDGRLHANGKVFHVKGINWCGPIIPYPPNLTAVSPSNRPLPHVGPGEHVGMALREIY
mmetsp:Transcript_25260/g.57552  ORF Transcript_25260/g.57552 Transcript_25260/m.57552 type:complete len:115 (-) Transcript_25260:3008-3352(-)